MPFFTMKIKESHALVYATRFLGKCRYDLKKESSKNMENSLIYDKKCKGKFMTLGGRGAGAGGGYTGGAHTAAALLMTAWLLVSI